MSKVIGIEYLSVKEASRRYGRSISWFRERKKNKKAPYPFQLGGKGKLFYHLEKTDTWFQENMKECV